MRLRDLVAVASLSALVVTLAPTTARATGTWTDPGVITDITQQGPDYDFVNLGVTGVLSGCSNASGFLFSVSDEKTKRMFSMLLAAQAAGRQVRLHISAINPTTCHGWAGAYIDGVIVIT